MQDDKRRKPSRKLIVLYLAAALLLAVIAGTAVRLKTQQQETQAESRPDEETVTSADTGASEEASAAEASAETEETGAAVTDCSTEKVPESGSSSDEDPLGPDFPYVWPTADASGTENASADTGAFGTENASADTGASGTDPYRPTRAAETGQSGGPEETTQTAPAYPTEPASLPEESSTEAPEPHFEEDPGNTAALFLLFSTPNTNNTDPESPYRTMTEEFRGQLDALAERWVAGELSAAEAKRQMEALTFYWEDLPGVAFHFSRDAVAVYEVTGHDATAIRDRILLSNTGGRHYLFLRVFYDAGRNVTRVYMANGLIW